MRLTLRERADAYKRAFPKQPASWPWMVREDGRDVLYAIWCIGANYGNENPLYGSYPRGYLKRLLAFFPDVAPRDLLHAFSGLLPPGGYTRLDLKPERKPDVVGNVYDAGRLFTPARFQLVAADPPYSDEDAEQYDTPPLNRRRAIAALADVTAPRGMMAWLDTQWPMHAKRQWVTVGRIMVERSTQHRTRSLHLFERTAA